LGRSKQSFAHFLSQKKSQKKRIALIEPISYEETDPPESERIAARSKSAGTSKPEAAEDNKQPQNHEFMSKIEVLH